MAHLATWRSLIQKGVDLLSGAPVRKGSAALVDQAVFSATNFLTGIIVGRSCTKEQFGLFSLGFSIWLFVMSLQTWLIMTPYMVYSPRLEPGELACYTGSTLMHQAAISLLALVALALGAALLGLGVGPRGLAPVVWTLAAVISFILLREYIRQISFANFRYHIALLLDVVVSVAQLGGLLLLSSLGLVSASSPYWVIGAACALAASGWLVSLRSSFSLHLGRAIADFSLNWKFGKWVFAGGLLWVLGMELYPWILTACHGSSATGVWAASFGVASVANPLLFGLMSFFGPYLARSYAEGGAPGLRRGLFRSCTCSTLMVAPLSLALLVYGEPLLVGLYGRQYAGHGAVVSVLALNLLVSSFAFSFSKALYAMERDDQDCDVNLIALFVLATLGLWLVKTLGPVGAACGLVAGNSATAAARYLLLRRLVRCAPAPGKLAS